MSEHAAPLMVITGLLTQVEFDRIPVPQRAELEARTRALIERYGEDGLRTDRDRYRNELAFFFGVELDEYPVGTFVHSGVSRLRPPS